MHPETTSAKKVQTNANEMKEKMQRNNVQTCNQKSAARKGQVQQTKLPHTLSHSMKHVKSYKYSRKMQLQEN